MEKQNPQRNQEEQPDAFRLWNSGLGAGEIQDSSGKCLWTYRPPSSSWWKCLYHFVRRPDFILSDPNEVEVLRIVQTKRFPLRQFSMVQHGAEVGRIQEQSFTTTAYSVQFNEGPGWTFSKPLFTANFFASCADGESIRVHIRFETEWYVHRGDTKDDFRMIASLAFVHSEHCRT